MWRFKPFMQKEQTGLEGRFIDVGNLKIHVRNIIAEGGFSCVYLARDAVDASKQYALKHIICNDEESLELAIKEINVMKLLKGHPNVVTLYAHTILDMGRTKEAFLVIELCEKSLVSMLENRGTAYFEEKQILSIFRDVCNAVFAMHCQAPPIAHRGLKAENLLLGSEGFWKLCDFGSTSTNHKRFEKPEEMGIEEDNIRKYTTPAYRAPEMWDLFLREIINEKVDIWALGCLLFRICYFKSAFDGESKLQILNGNYRIPELPKYSSFITDLIRDMLRASPDARPDITQVWFSVNELLPVVIQKSVPDNPPKKLSPDVHEGNLSTANKVSLMPRRSPPPPPSEESAKNPLQSSLPSRAGGGGRQIGAFWSSQHSKDSVAEDKGGPKFDEELTDQRTSKHDKSHPGGHSSPQTRSLVKEENVQTHNTRRNVHAKSHKPEEGHSNDFQINFFDKDSNQATERPKASNSEIAATFQDNAFNTFVAEFDTKKFKSAKEDMPMPNAEVEKLKEQLKQVNLEKSEITSKYEKLIMICRSQRQELQELKQALAAKTPSPNKDASRNPASSGVGPSAIPLQKEKIDLDKHSQSPDPKSWQPFADPKQQSSLSGHRATKSVRTINQNKQAAQTPDTWGFGAESFTAAPSASTYSSKRTDGERNSQLIGESKVMESKPASQPAGWAGF